MKIDPKKKAKIKATFNPEFHPRYPKGHPQGGEFMAKGSSDYTQALISAHENAKRSPAKVSVAKEPEPSIKKTPAKAPKSAKAPKKVEPKKKDSDADELDKMLSALASEGLDTKFNQTKIAKLRAMRDRGLEPEVLAASPKKQKTAKKPSGEKVSQNKLLNAKMAAISKAAEGKPPDNLGDPMNGSMLSNSPKKAAMLAANLTGVSEKRGAQMAESLNAFSYHHDSRIRQAQRNGENYNLVNDGTGGDRKVDYNVVDTLDEYLDKAPKYKGDIHRGLRFNKKDGEAYLKAIQSAGGFTQREVSSFSADKDVADKFAAQGWHPVSITMHLNDNKSGVGMRRFSEYSTENEVLSPAGTKFKVKEIVKSPIYGDKQVYDVYVEEVQPEKVAERRSKLKEKASSAEAISQRSLNKSERIKLARQQVAQTVPINGSGTSKESAKSKQVKDSLNGLLNIIDDYDLSKDGFGQVPKESYNSRYHEKVQKVYNEVLDISKGLSDATIHPYYANKELQALLIASKVGSEAYVKHLITLPNGHKSKKKGSGQKAIDQAYADGYNNIVVQDPSIREGKYLSQIGFTKNGDDYYKEKSKN